MAVDRATWVDYALRVVTLAGLSMPSFWVGVMLVLGLLLCLFRWSPPVTFTTFGQDPLANLSQLVWPMLVVGFRSAALSTRMMRSALLDVLRDDYVRTARAKGLPERSVVVRHAVRNALLPVITVVGLESAVDPGRAGGDGAGVQPERPGQAPPGGRRLGGTTR